MEEKILEIMERFIVCKLIYIFGSYGTEYFNQDSDIDIAFLAKEKVDAKTKFDLKLYLIQELGYEIDLIDLDDAKPVLAKEIVCKGRVIYAMDEIAKDEFVYKTMALYGQYVDDIKVIVDKVKERGHIL